MLGVIADDFTGATDIADVLVDRGFRTVVIPFAAAARVRQMESSTVSSDAIVIALKSRTAPVQDAVNASLSALFMLRHAGCDRFYFKYCSTFDSTPHGNIGPVLDALMEELDVGTTVVTPANPRNGRTVYQGHLFVGDVLLEHSGMERHPLTPMTDSDVRRLLDPQSSARVEWVALSQLREGASAARAAFEYAWASDGGDERVAVVADAIDERDLLRIADAVADLRLISGSAGLARGLTGPHDLGARVETVVPGRAAILSGSASDTTRRQIEWSARSIPVLELDLEAAVASPHDELVRIVEWARTRPAEAPVLICAPSRRASNVETSTELGGAIEAMLAHVAEALVAEGFMRLLVAGGETSGAVVDRLGVTSLVIGTAIAEGVVWTLATTQTGQRINLALKSGNFGDADLFERAWSNHESHPNR